MMRLSDTTAPDRPGISIIIPTHGRSTLGVIVQEIKDQMTIDDQLIVVGDGPQPKSREIMEPFLNPESGILYFEYGPTNKWGLAQLDYGQHIAKMDFISFVGDDDHITEGGMERMRKCLAKTTIKPHIFAMEYQGSYFGMNGNLYEGYFSGQQFVVPNIESYGYALVSHQWNESESSDWHYMKNTLEHWQTLGRDAQPHMHNEVIYRLDQRNHGKVF